MNKKLVIGVALVALIALLITQFGDQLTLENAKAQQAALAEFIEQNFVSLR